MHLPRNSETLHAPLISKRDAAFRRGSIAAGAAVLAMGLIAGCRSKQAVAPTDQQMTSAIQSKIQGESALQGQPIEVSVTGGVATLSGTVIDDASRALAGNDSGSVTGIKTVVNNLTLQPEQQAQAAAGPAPQSHEGKRHHRDRRDQRRQAYNAPPQ